jgi:hypothetical protein
MSSYTLPFLLILSISIRRFHPSIIKMDVKKKKRKEHIFPVRTSATETFGGGKFFFVREPVI